MNIDFLLIGGLGGSCVNDERHHFSAWEVWHLRDCAKLRRTSSTNTSDLTLRSRSLYQSRRPWMHAAHVAAGSDPSSWAELVLNSIPVPRDDPCVSESKQVFINMLEVALLRTLKRSWQQEENWQQLARLLARSVKLSKDFIYSNVTTTIFLLQVAYVSYCTVDAHSGRGMVVMLASLMPMGEKQRREDRRL
jgi:hypothetical protein